MAVVLSGKEADPGNGSLLHSVEESWPHTNDAEPSTKSTLVNRAPSPLPLPDFHGSSSPAIPEAASSLVSSTQDFTAEPEDDHSGKIAGSHSEVPLSLGRARRAPKPTLKLQSPIPILPRKRKVNGRSSNQAREKRRRSTHDPLIDHTTAYDTPRPTPNSTGHQSPALSTHSITQPLHLLPILSVHKQNFTTLRVSVTADVFVGIIPLKLRSCMTMDTFFASIITATRNTDDHETSISAIMVSFDWKDADDRARTILVRKDITDSFEVFLETIDDAPCWNDEKGKCEVEVDVVRT